MMLKTENGTLNICTSNRGQGYALGMLTILLRFQKLQNMLVLEQAPNNQCCPIGKHSTVVDMTLLDGR